MSVTNAHYQPISHTKHLMSRHARKRAAQRGIPEKLLPLLLNFGEREHDGRGGIRCFMSDKALQALTALVGNSEQVRRLAGMYAVVSADEATVITLGHRY